MGREWRPGDVVDAFIPTRIRRHRLVYMGKRGGTWPWRMVDTEGDAEGCGVGADNVRDARLLLPALEGLVVIDPEALPIDDLLRALDRWRQWSSLNFETTAVTALFDAIAKQTAPAKPEEPLGWLAVIEDADGDPWYRVIEGSPETGAWARRGQQYIGTVSVWRDVTAVKVLSEGVPS